MLRAMLSRVYAQMQVFSMRRHVSEVFFLQISSSNGSKPIFYTTISRYSTIFACQLSLALIVRSLMYSCHLCSEQSTHSFAPALYSCPSPLAPAFCSHTALSPAYHYTNTSEYQEKVASRPFMSPPPQEKACGMLGIALWCSLLLCVVKGHMVYSLHPTLPSLINSFPSSSPSLISYMALTSQNAVIQLHSVQEAFQ